MRTLLALLPSLLFAAPLPAQTPAADAARLSRYDIEVLVFEHRMPDLATDELVSAEPAERARRALETAVAAEPSSAEPYLRPTVAALLEADGRYRVLAHAHWQQAVEPSPRSAVRAVRIAPLPAARPGEFEGAVRFSMSRFLHLDVNMLFRPEGRDAAVVYALSEQRRVKSQETHYFDHPQFGALVRVMPLDPPARR